MKKRKKRPDPPMTEEDFIEGLAKAWREGRIVITEDGSYQTIEQWAPKEKIGEKPS